jgi:5-methylcytosine-specific restriction endonuclease McrA
VIWFNRSSFEWKEFRESIIKSHPFCIICHETKDLAVHHIEKTGNNFDEYLKPQNVVVLCKKCHFASHFDELEQIRVIRSGFSND